MALISDIVPVEFDFGASKTLPAADHSTPSNLRPPTAADDAKLFEDCWE
jgi:hypothetical protein